MSLILDALRKLEREKKKNDPGVLVVGALPWEGLRPRRMRGAALVLVSFLAIGAAAATWWVARKPRTPPAAELAPRAVEAAPLAASGRTGAPASPHPATAALARREAPPARQLRLPTAPLLASATPRAPAPPREPQLNAISRQDGKPVAVIDGRLVHEGDSIEGVRVLRIGETQVEVEVHGRRLILHF